MKTAEFEKLQLSNTVLANDYVLEHTKYDYLFFKIPAEDYGMTETVALTMDVVSETAVIALNEYLNHRTMRISGRDVVVRFDIAECESGENTLAFKGQIHVKRIDFITGGNGGEASETAEVPHLPPSADPVHAAARFLLNAQIQGPGKSPFHGSCYAIYDYTNGCHRMPCWLWSDAPIVSAMLKLVQENVYPDMNASFERLALDIGKAFLRNQITDPSDEVYGAFVSRHRYYGKTARSFDRLLGPNDTSFTVKWAMLPLYEHTRDETYLHASKIALDWVEHIIDTQPFVPSHYYFEEKAWENKAFVDTGFNVEGFAAYDSLTGGSSYDAVIRFCMDRFIGQFRLDNGYYGQNYTPGSGVDDRLFTRGHAWVLEGLAACCSANGDDKYVAEALALSEKMIENQNADGSWNYLLGYYAPDPAVKAGSGICEKTIPIFAYLFLELYAMTGRKQLLDSADRALAWCEASMSDEAGSGYGGIAGASLASGITGLPFLKVATGYANAFYLLAKLKRRGIR
ncbi:hypothetical protein [Paenibacillus piri]|uniref:Glycosyl hydrolase family 88 n=1 Tax=Paenibacillus piri TaxID=2547395 RepID=A0A4R5KYI7_9BACL|nr:hypothetical protein [Paenibacillus piri]TDG00296.1 hypothetical protein E1757_01230 [Paenibacillus piri]